MKILCFCGNDHVRLARIIEKTLSESPFSECVSSTTQVLKPYEKRDPDNEVKIILAEVEKETKRTQQRPVVAQLSIQGWKKLKEILQSRGGLAGLYGIFIHTTKKDAERNFLSLSSSFVGEKLDSFLAESEIQSLLFDQEKEAFYLEISAELSDDESAKRIKENIKIRML